MKKPNAFIVGAPKCGTTAMASYLSEHPDIYVSPIKEPHYFIKDDMPKKTNLTYEEYLELFSGATTEKILLEASVWYLYGKNSIRKIKDFSSDAKIILMLRRPDEMVYSMHNQAFITRNEDIKNFEDAWKAVEERRKNKLVPKYCKDVSMLFYDEIAKYAEQLKRVYSNFKRENVLVIFYDDFKKNPETVHLSVLNFLNVEPMTASTYETVNKNKIIKSTVLGDFTRRPPKIISNISVKLKRLTGAKKIGFLSYLRTLNEKEAKRPPLSESLRVEILRSYKSDIDELSEITGRNLKEWLK